MRVSDFLKSCSGNHLCGSNPVTTFATVFWFESASASFLVSTRTAELILGTSRAHLHESMEGPIGQNIRVFRMALIAAVERLIRP